jgi:alkylation response protein AidB-like acyl-CoA dehydrogenase
MDFDFSPEQYLLRDTVRDLLRRECTPEAVRAAWTSETGRSPQRWRKLAQLGVVGLTVAEEHGGAGMDEVDLVLILEEAGRSLLPEPLLETTAVGAPLLARCGSDALRAEWLPRIAAGDATLTVGLAGSPYVADATADLVVLERDGALHAVTQDRLTLQPLRSVDGARRLFSVTAELGDDTVLSSSAADARWAFDHAAAATAAELVGVAEAMLDMTVAYVKQREQFGRRIGSFQAVQHKLAETLLLVDSARSAVYYAAWALANGTADASIAASVAKAYASDAERRANAEALQLHGGIGFTWEHPAHLYLKRAKSSAIGFGTAERHRAALARLVDLPGVPGPS